MPVSARGLLGCPRNIASKYFSSTYSYIFAFFVHILTYLPSYIPVAPTSLRLTCFEVLPVLPGPGCCIHTIAEVCTSITISYEALRKYRLYLYPISMFHTSRSCASRTPLDRSCQANLLPVIAHGPNRYAALDLESWVTQNACDSGPWLL